MGIFMKKLCCSCNTAITQGKLCNNSHDLTCCVSKVSLQSIDNIQIDFSDKRYRATNLSDNYKDIDHYLLIKFFRKKYKVVVMIIKQMKKLKQVYGNY